MDTLRLTLSRLDGVFGSAAAAFSLLSFNGDLS